MTQLANALREAGIVTVAERLRDMAINVLAVHASSRAAASEAMYAAVRYDTDLLDELFAPYRELALKRLLGAVESEMRQHERAEQEKAGSGGRGSRDDHGVYAPSARPGGGLEGGESQGAVAPAAPPPDRRMAQESVANVMRLTMLDTFKIDGIAIGDMQAGAARAWARREGRHVRWVGLITANVPAADPIRRWIAPDDADALWARSLDSADA
jgi:hypothetical protein